MCMYSRNDHLAIFSPSRERFGRPETNCVVVGELSNGSAPRLYAGCGDKNVHVWDMEAGRHIVSAYKCVFPYVCVSG